MEYNKTKIGKITKLKESLGIGEITTEDGTFLFKIKNTKEDLKEGDLVYFRGEKEKTENMAFFVNKVTNLNDIPNNKISENRVYPPDFEE